MLSQGLLPWTTALLGSSNMQSVMGPRAGAAVNQESHIKAGLRARPYKPPYSNGPARSSRPRHTALSWAAGWLAAGRPQPYTTDAAFPELPQRSALCTLPASAVLVSTELPCLLTCAF